MFSHNFIGFDFHHSKPIQCKSQIVPSPNQANRNGHLYTETTDHTESSENDNFSGASDQTVVKIKKKKSVICTCTQSELLFQHAYIQRYLAFSYRVPFVIGRETCLLQYKDRLIKSHGR